MSEGQRETSEMQKEANHGPHEKAAPKAEDDERIDPPKPAEAGPIRGAGEYLDIARKLDEEPKRGKA